jgi:hypothetical protein
VELGPLALSAFDDRVYNLAIKLLHTDSPYSTIQPLLISHPLRLKRKASPSIYRHAQSLAPVECYMRVGSMTEAFILASLTETI